MHTSHPILESRVVDMPDPDAERWAPLQNALERFEHAMGQAQLDARDEEARANFRHERRKLASMVAGWPRKERAGSGWETLRRVLSRLGSSGLQDNPWDEEDEVLARSLNLSRWTDLVARMLLGPVGRGGPAPRFADVPDEWWGGYAEWAFQAPQGFVTSGQSEAYARQYLPLVCELAEWVDRNAGSATVRAAADAYLRVSNQIPLYFTAGHLREHTAARGRIIQRLLADRSVPYDAFALPREGRRLRVGVVNRHFGPQTETYTTLPSFEALDPERFEVLLFACRSDGSPLERYCRSKAGSFEVLPADLAGQLSVLRAAALDVVVWGTNLTAVVNEITLLALHRVAPLQVVNNSSCITSGLPDCDLYVSGDLTEADDAPGHFTERLGLLPGPTHAFNYEADRQAPAREWTKADLGIPADAFVFVSAANYFKIIPEVREAWARLLASVPGSRLLLHPFNPNWSSTYPIQRFCAEFEAVLARHGVDHDRLVVSTMKLPSRSDVGALMAVGDLYLDTAPFGGVNSLIDPLEHGVPVLAWQGDTMRARMGAALLRSLGLEDCIALDEASYLEAARRLALDADARTSLSSRIRAAMERVPVFLDPLAASDAFGALIETAFDDIAAKGPRAFRLASIPLRARQTAALSAPERRALGNRLVSEGRAARGVDYLLAALQQSEADPRLWLDVARALRANRQHNEALQALEAALRLDETLSVGWALMADIAEERGNTDLALQARSMAGGGASAGASAPAHVLLYTDDPEHGGVAQYNHTLLLALARAGYRVTCVQTRSASPLVAEQAACGVRHVWLDYDTGKDFARTVTDETAARRIFNADRPDLVLFSDCSPVSNLAAREAARVFGLPYMCVVGFVGEYLAANFASVLPRLASQYAAAEEVVAVSGQNLDLLRGRFGLSSTRGRVVHYGRPERFFSPRDEARRCALRSELGVGPDDLLCLTVARLAEVKGHDLLFEAAARLQVTPVGRRLHYACVGGGDLRDALAARLARLGLDGRAHLLGQRWDTEAWYDAADIFVLPSRMEGMPLAIMEAMAKRLPVVATAVSGIPEELGETGLLLPDPNLDAGRMVEVLVDTLARLAESPASRTGLADAARARAEAMFREELMVGRTLDLVSAVLVKTKHR